MPVKKKTTKVKTSPTRITTGKKSQKVGVKVKSSGKTSPGTAKKTVHKKKAVSAKKPGKNAKKTINKKTGSAAKARVKSRSSGIIKPVRKRTVSPKTVKSREEEDIYTIRMVSGGASVIQRPVHSVNENSTNSENFYRLERIPDRVEQSPADEIVIEPEYTDEMITDHLLNYFLYETEQSVSPGVDPQSHKRNISPEDIHIESLDLEIRNRISDLVLALLKKDDHNRLYKLLVEYKEFIRDIMNLIDR